MESIIKRQSKWLMFITTILFTVITISCTVQDTSLNRSQMNDINNNEKGYVPDTITAIKIAEAIWLPIYGEKIYISKPFKAELIDNNIWKVTGTLHTAKGGVPYIEIQKSDCKILKVYHTK